MGQVRLPDLVIAAAGTTSNAIGASWLKHLRSVTLFGPAALTGTVTVETSAVNGDSAVTGDYRNQQSAGADVTVAADKAVTLSVIAARGLRVVSGSAEAAERTFQVVGSDDLTL
jgi:hypothetical protein